MSHFGCRIHSLSHEGFHPVELFTEGGPVGARFSPASTTTQDPTTPQNMAALFVGGVGGDWDSPALGLYPRLAKELPRHGIAALRLRFRDPRNMAGAIADVLAGLEFLSLQSIAKTVLVGHSFGGAVVLQAAVAAPDKVAGVITLATQSYGATHVGQITCPVLLVHGEADEILPAGCSQVLYTMIHSRREMQLYQNAGHSLDEVAGELRRLVTDWILAKL